MKLLLRNEIEKMITRAVEDQKEFYINPLMRRVEIFDGNLSCMKGVHGNPIISPDRQYTVCPRCYHILGEIIAPDTRCKAEGKKN